MPSKSSNRSSRSKSSDRWLQRQRKDRFVKDAQANGHISRAHFKLRQIDERYRLLRPDDWVLELGAAPGGWTHYIEERLSQGRLLAIDLLPITAGAETQVICGRAGEPEVDRQIQAWVDERDPDRHAQKGIDLVLSDMAPNMSGIRAVDQARSMDLADIALDACHLWLKPKGHLAIKAFQGEGLDSWVNQRRQEFDKVLITKPKASRSESREVFVVAMGYRRHLTDTD